jgi:hydrogenase maturation protease
MKRTIVLGIGNRLMCDDGIGVRIVEALGAGNTTENIRYLAGETDVFYCLDELEKADHCILIDAACTGREPCCISVFDLKEVLSQSRALLSLHDFDLIHAMKRYQVIKEGILVTIEICSAVFSEELTELMQERLDEIIREVRVIINNSLNTRTDVM